MSAAFLTHELLEECRVRHGFGLRGSPAPAPVVCPRQVHGTRVARVDLRGTAAPSEADAIVSDAPDLPVAVVTADCVPILLAARSGAAVAAIHVGWRGLARGVVGAGVEALRDAVGGRGELVAALGPHIGSCCYEVDAPVVSALRAGLAAEVGDALRPSGEDHFLLDLALLVRRELVRAGLPPGAVGGFPGACTHCEPERFHSYRREGPRSGRMVHFVSARALGGGS